MSKPQKIPIAAQLYTVRDLCAQDFGKTTQNIAKLGYRQVEVAGYGNLKTAAEARQALDDAGLRVAGTMHPIEAFETDANRVLDEADALGTKVVIVPWIAEARRKDAAAWRTLAQSLSKVAQAAGARGFEFAYHNHSFEFQRFEGKYAMDILFDTASPAVKAELDVYWLKHGGVEPAQWITKMGSRVLTLHLKDMAAGAEWRFAPVGTGILDFRAIIEAAAKAGVRYGAVEQDETYDLPPLEALRVSLQNLRELGLA